MDLPAIDCNQEESVRKASSGTILHPDFSYNSWNAQSAWPRGRGDRYGVEVSLWALNKKIAITFLIYVIH